MEVARITKDGPGVDGYTCLDIGMSVERTLWKEQDCTIARLDGEPKGGGKEERMKADEELTPSGMKRSEITQPFWGTIRLKCAAPAGG